MYQDTAILFRMKEELQDSESQADQAVQGWEWDSQDRDHSKMQEAEQEIMLRDLEAEQVDQEQVIYNEI